MVKFAIAFIALTVLIASGAHAETSATNEVLKIINTTIVANVGNIARVAHAYPSMVMIENLVVGDMIEGLDENKMPQFCKVVAVGQLGRGELFGNYTKGHYVLDDGVSDIVVQHGERGEASTNQTRFDVLTECPVGLDRSGVAFTAIDSRFCGTNALVWSDYVLLHTAILKIIQQSGPYWFTLTAYKDSTFATYTPKICAAMLKCVRPHGDCIDLENIAVDFIQNVMSQDAREATRSAFPHLGSPLRTGSIAYTVTSHPPLFFLTIGGIAVITSSFLVFVLIVAVTGITIHHQYLSHEARIAHMAKKFKAPADIIVEADFDAFIPSLVQK